MPRLTSHTSQSNQSGNIFFAIFGAIALVGLLGAAMMTFMKGPLSTAVKLTKINSAETQMTIGAQVAVMSTTSQANSGDCDSDGFVEPQPWRAATTEPVPTNGGLIPLSLGISKKDPWGTEYGYCVWNHGSVTSGGTCGANMLTGTNSTAYPVVAIVSAGPDKAFTTTCRTFASADTNSDGDLDDAADHPLVSKAAETDDDIIQTFTYEEATAASGGLWSLKSGDPTTAVISKKIEATGTANLTGGVLLPDSSLITCDATTAGVMAKNASGTGIEICDGAGSWTSISGGGGGATDSFTDSTATVCDATTAGKVRYNSATSLPEFCNGTAWSPFTLSSPTGNLVVSPASNYSMTVTGPCSGGNCPYAYSGWTTFTVSNSGQVATSTLSVPTLSGANSANYEFDLAASTCDNGVALAANGSAGSTCVIVLRAKATGNISYSAQVNVVAGALSATIPLYGTSTGFACGSGTYGWGGIVYGSCTGAGGTEPGTNQLIVQEAGCGNSTYEPTCTGVASADASWAWANNIFAANAANTTSGLQNDANLAGYYGPYPAAEYCRNLVKNGYTDWFLPSASELSALYTDTTIRATFQTVTNYWSSNYSAFDPNNPDSVTWFNFANSSSSSYGGGANKVRCARRHNAAAVTATPDTSPLFMYMGGGNYGTSNSLVTLSTLKNEYTSSLSTPVISSWPVKIISHNTTISISVSGTGAAYRINGGTWLTSGTLDPGNNQIEFKATSPATYGAETTVTVNIGTQSGSWRLRTYDPSVTKNIFVTSTTYSANLGGLSGANNLCRVRAKFAGLSQYGTYVALLATTSASGISNIGWNWGTLQTVNGSTFVGNPGAFERFNIAGSLNRNEFGAVSSNPVFWSGMHDGYYGNISIPSVSGGYTCSNWTNSSGSAGIGGYVGGLDQSFASAGWTYACNTALPIVCVGPNPDITGTTCPNAVDSTATKSAAGSYSVTIPGGCPATFKLWGGAGGKAGTYTGGGGGYAYFSETPSSDTTYFYTVGGHGVDGGYPGFGGSSASGFAGGSGCLGGSNYPSGGGGGATLLYRGNISSANLVAVAAGGGGTTSQNSSGGKAGGDASNSYSASSTTGGNGACSGYSSGGGGAGFDGTSGGGANAVNATATNIVGYGGQNWVTTGAGITSSTSAGSGVLPGNTSDSQRPSGAGCGASTGCAPFASNSNDGAVVVIY